MKIVILVSYTYPFVGSGIGNVALVQAEELSKLGHKVTLVSGNIPKTDPEFVLNGVKHIKLQAFNYLDKFGIPVPFFFFNKNVIKAFKATDIIHCHEMLYPYSLQAAILAKYFKKPFILTQHAGYIKYKSRFINLVQLLVNKTIGNLVLSLSDRILVVNEEVKKWLGKNGERAEHLMNGVDTQLFYPVSNMVKVKLRRKHGFPEGKKILLHVGRLVEKKGFHRVFENRSDKYFTIIAGGGGIPPHMNNYHDKVKFTGAVDQAELAELYQLSDVFVLPSDCEGFPLSIQEAMATGLPIISSNHPGFEKYLDKKFVRLINPENGELKKAIKEVMNDAGLIREMSDYSLRITKEKASWDTNLKTLLNIYSNSLQ